MLIQVFLTFVGLVALIALKWPHRGVNNVMVFQGGARCESLAAVQPGVFIGSFGVSRLIEESWFSFLKPPCF